MTARRILVQSLTYGECVATERSSAHPVGRGPAGSTVAPLTPTHPIVQADAVEFGFPSSPGVWGVRLEVDFPLPGTDPDFAESAEGWSLHLPRPAVDRMEYQFTVRHGDVINWITDPANPETVPNPFGQKSVVRFPGYTPPPWLGEGALRHAPVFAAQPIDTPAGKLAEAVPAFLWSPPQLAADTPAPLLVAHDGSDMADRGSLLVWASKAASGRPFRVLLLDPVDGRRDEWYAGNPAYCEHLAEVVLPTVRRLTPVSSVVALGASLGALAMLSTATRHPRLFDALVLQSGSFFTAELDPQEIRFHLFAQVCAAVREIISTPPAGKPGPILMTCGFVEENRENNEQMAKALVGQGHQVDLQLVPDAHTMIGWRDAWYPAVDRLLATLP